jgi:predicted enzyme related to lactoylglutathione lyase
MDKVGHFEITAKNIPKVKNFYEKTFGWKFDKWKGEGMEYWMINAAGVPAKDGINGGVMMPNEEMSKHIHSVVNTIGVKDIDKTAKTIEKNGGNIIMPKQEVMGVGWLLYFKDPEGNVFGAMQPTGNMESM